MDTLKSTILVVKLKKRDADAFAEMYDTYLDKIYRFVYFKVSSVEEAQDITSEVFLKAWEYLGREDAEIQNLNSFLYHIARNLVIDFYRQRAKRDTISVENTSDLLTQIPDHNQNPASQITQELAQKQIQNYLGKLKDEYREVVILKYIEGLSTGEIADILEKNKGNVRVLLHRAMKALTEIANEQEEEQKEEAVSSELH